MEITNRHHGGYFPTIGAQAISQIINTNLTGLSGVVDQLKVERRTVGVTHLSPVDNTYFVATAVDIQKNPVYVPSLEELGYDGSYELRASISVTAYDPTNVIPTLELRLLNAGDETVVSGFTASKTLNGNGTDELVQSGYAPLTPGKSYLIDFRTDAGKQARVRVYSLHLQIVKG